VGLKEVHLDAEVTAPSAAPEGAPAAVAPAPLSTLERSESALPGVVARNWDREIAPIKEGAAPAAAPATEVSSSAAAEVAASAVGTTGGGEAPVPAPPAPKYLFGGVEFEDQTKAEHSFKTLRGMHAAKDRENQALRLKALELERDLARLKNPSASEVTPKPKEDGQAAAAQSPQAAADTYAVFELLKEKFGPKIANEWFTEQTDARVEARVEAKLQTALKEIKDTLAPMQESHAQLQERAEMAGIFQRMATYTLPDNSPAYPELNDERAMRDVGVLWKNLGFDANSLKTPKGVHLAIVAYRDAMATRARVASSKTPKPAAAVARPAVDPGVVSTGGDSAVRHPSQVPAVDPNDIGERLLRANVKSDAKLGYRVRTFGPSA
jgi:hypothetical protein